MQDEIKKQTASIVFKDEALKRKDASLNLLNSTINNLKQNLSFWEEKAAKLKHKKKKYTFILFISVIMTMFLCLFLCS